MHILSKDSREWVFIAAFTSLLLVGIVLVLLKNPIAIDDGLRHYAYGKLMMERGIFSMQWSQVFDHGYLRTHAVDPWFLSNVLFGILSPLGPVATPKAFALLSVVALLSLFLFIFRTWKTPPFIAAVLLFMLLFFDPMFYVRLLLGRPYELVTVFSLLTLFSALQGQRFVLGLSIAVSVLLSQLFIFPFILVLAVIVWRCLLQKYRESFVLLRALLSGLVLGFVLHPHPWEYALYIGDAFLLIPFLPDVQLGMEMQSSVMVVARLWMTLGFSLLLTLAFLRHEQGGVSKFHASGLSVLAALSLVFSLLFLQWSRAIDFAWPITILYLTLLLSLSPSLVSSTLDRILPVVVLPMKKAALLLLIVVCFFTWIGTTGVLASTDSWRSLTPYKESLASVPTNAHILNVDWHMFAPMFAVRPDLHFAAGIDPSYTFLTDPKAHRLLAVLSDREFGGDRAKDSTKTEDWLRTLLKEYPSSYLVIERERHPALVESLVQLGLVDDAASNVLAVFRTEKIFAHR